MAVHRTFIACSSKARPLAETLYTAMTRHADFGTVVPWWSLVSSTQELGMPTLGGLLSEAGKTDFAVALLTDDDFSNKGDASPQGSTEGGSDKSKRAPRDNCVFEAGLFMGALGLEAKRCALVTSIEKRLLPSDLQEFMRVDVPAMSTMPKGQDSLNNVATLAAGSLLAHVRSLKEPPKRPLLRILTPGELMDREKPEGVDEGQLSRAGGHGVVVNTMQPLEGQFAVASQVIANMEQDVDYIYFFRAEKGLMQMVAHLVQSFALANLAGPDELPERRRELVRENSSAIVNRLKKLQKHLWIHFLMPERVPLHFCVHNATNPQRAKCYLRYHRAMSEGGAQDVFALWCEGQEAVTVVRDLMLLSVPDKWEDPAIFYPSRDFDLYGPEGKTVLEELEKMLKQALTSDLFDTEFRDLLFLNRKGA